MVTVGTLQNSGLGGQAFDPVRIASLPPRKSMPPRRGMPSGRRVHRGRAVSAGRLIARLRRPWHRGSRRRCDAEQYSTAPARWPTGEKRALRVQTPLDFARTADFRSVWSSPRVSAHGPARLWGQRAL